MNPVLEVMTYLLLGHALAQFAWRRDPLDPRASAWAASRWIGHVMLTVLTLGVTTLPVASPPSLLFIPCLALAQGVLDLARHVVERRVGARLGTFLAAQGLHLLLLVVVASLLASPSVWRMVWPIDPTIRHFVRAVAVLLTTWILVGLPGQLVVGAILERCRLPRNHTDVQGEPSLGRVIGVLERLLVVTLVLVGAWIGIGLILAAKSIARFKDLEQREFGEYYLIGTLTSMLVAVVVGLLGTVLLGGDLGWGVVL